MNWYKKAQYEKNVSSPIKNINDGAVEKFISQRTGLQIQYDHYNWDHVSGKSIDFINDQVLVDTEIKETENEVYLTGIQTRDISDRTKKFKGSGKGTEVINALKEYAQLVNKKLIILDFTEHARPYWDKFKDFTEEGQFYPIDGRNHWIQNTKKYTPYGEENELV